MKSRLFIIVALVAVFIMFVAATQVQTGDGNISTPTNVSGSDLHSRNTAIAADTFSDTSVNKIYGPYELSTGRGGGPMANYLAIKADAITGTTPQMTVYFQLISGDSIADTISAWTYLCEINASAKDTVYDISGLVGKALVLMVDNTDSTACQIPGLLQFQIKDSKTEYIKLN